MNDPARSSRGLIFKHRYNPWALGALALSLIVMGGCEAVGIRDAQSLLFSSFQKSEVWGFLAGLGTTFAGVPDLIAMFKRRSSAGVHPRMAAILAVFQVTWIYYGLLIASRPVVAWNLIAVFINSLNVVAFLYFVRQERARASGRQAGDSR